MSKNMDVSVSVIRRLPRYYRFLGDLLLSGTERISSREFAELIGVTASQIRQDLNCFGGFGQQGYGYNVQGLHSEIGKILGLDKKRSAILVGAGNLGLALANHMRFQDRGFSLIGIFDNSPSKIGIAVGDCIVRDAAELEDFCRDNKPEAAILCIPKDVAIVLTDNLVSWGIKGFWNFSHYDMSVKYRDIAVENAHLGDSLMTLSYCIGDIEQSANN